MGLDLAASRKPDAILLDLGLPDQDGLDVLKALRQWTSVPIIIVSARGQEHDKVRGLNAGADDYLTKPFGIPELMARLRVALRHAAQKPEDAPPLYDHEGLKVDLVARNVWLKKKEIHLSPLQYDLLALLVRNAGRVVSQKRLYKRKCGAKHARCRLRLVPHLPSISSAIKSNPIPCGRARSKPNRAWATVSNRPTNKNPFL